jgi:hypothetical protein
MSAPAGKRYQAKRGVEHPGAAGLPSMASSPRNPSSEYASRAPSPSRSATKLPDSAHTIFVAIAERVNGSSGAPAGRDRNTTATCGTTVNADDRRATRLAIGARTDAPHTLVFSQEATWIGRRLVMRCDEMTMHLAVEPQHHEAVRRCGHGRARDRLIRRPGDIAAREQGEQMRSAQRGVEARLSYQDARQSGGGRFGRRGIDPGGQGRWRGAMSSRGRFRRMSAARGDGEYLYEARLHRAQASTTRRMTA